MFKKIGIMLTILCIVTPLFSGGKEDTPIVISAEEQLMIWIEKNSIEEVQQLIQDEDPSLNSISSDGETPLTLAASLGHKEITLLLLNNLADRNKTNQQGFTPLMASINQGHYDTAEVLLLWDADIKLQDQNGETALLMAARQDQYDLSQKILSIDPQKVDMDNQKNTVLHWAVYNGNPQMVSLFSDLPIAIDQENSQGDSPLSLALSSGNALLWETLLDGRELNTLITEQGNLLHWAVEQADKTLIPYLSEHSPSLMGLANGDGKLPIDLALYHFKELEYMEIAQFLIETGSPEPMDSDLFYFYEVFNRNRWDIDFGGGARALHLAAESNHMGAMELILREMDPPVDIRDENGATPLLYAIRNGHEDMAAFLVDQGSSVHISDTNGFSPIHYAIRLENYENLCELLRSNGASFNHQDALGNTPLHRVIQYNLGSARAEYLIQKGADSNVRNVQGNTPLMEALLSEDRLLIELLRDSGNLFAENQAQLSPILVLLAKDSDLLEWFFQDDNINLKDHQGNSVLHYAASYPSVELSSDTIRLLIRKGAQQHSRNSQGKTALHLSIQSGYANTSNLLVTLGSDLYMLDNQSYTPLMGAFEQGRIFIRDFLTNENNIIDTEDNQGNTPLFHSIWEDYPEIARELIELGADYNHQNLRGMTALLLAIEKGDRDLFYYLMDFGVDLHQGDNSGDTALHYLVKDSRSFDETLAEILLEQGIDTDIQNHQGMTAMHYCALFQNWEAMTFLAPRGADLDMGDRKGFSPLFYSVIENDLRGFEYLISQGANGRTRDSQGNTLLHAAVIEAMEDQNQGLIREIIRQGGDIYGANAKGDSPLKLALTLGPFILERLLFDLSINTQDNQGNTPLHFIISQSSDTDVWNLLVDLGADLNLKNSRGMTPYQWAQYMGYNEEDIRILIP